MKRKILIEELQFNWGAVVINHDRLVVSGGIRAREGWHIPPRVWYGEGTCTTVYGATKEALLQKLKITEEDTVIEQ